MGSFIRLFSFYGRQNRLEFFTVWLASIIVLILGIAMAALVPKSYGEGPIMAFVFVFLAMKWMLLASSAKRFHDMGQSGWFCLVFFIPIVNLIALAFLLFSPGETDANDYGVPTGFFSPAIAPQSSAT